MRKIFRNARVLDATGAKPFAADVLIENNRIKTIARDLGQIDGAGADEIDADGRTLMPGMVEGHAHITFVGIELPSELGEMPPEDHTIKTAANARLLLDHGFTSAYSAASAKPRIDVAIREAIAEGILVGPRLRAASPEITVTAGLGDERKAHLYRESFGMIGDGPEELRKVCRLCIREGIDNLKINISGDEFATSARAEITPMAEDEIAACVAVGRDFGKRISAHARAAESVKRAVRHGIDVIYHCDFADEEALDMLESVKDRIFVGPAFGLVHNCVKDQAAIGFDPQMAEDLGLYRKFDACVATYHEMRKRGIRVVIGGDYGFAQTPMGMNARDIAHFVDYFGYSPDEAIQCATRIGGELMGMGDELGQVREGWLADLIMVEGDPLADPGLLQHKENILFVMKDGVLYKDARATGGVAQGLIAAQ